MICVETLKHCVQRCSKSPDKPKDANSLVDANSPWHPGPRGLKKNVVFVVRNDHETMKTMVVTVTTTTTTTTAATATASTASTASTTST